MTSSRDRRPLRVLYLHHYGPFGGASRSLLELIESFPKDAVLACVATPGGQFARMLEQREIPVEAVPGVALIDHTRYSHYQGVRWLVVLRELAKLPLTAIGLVRAKRRWPDVDVVHVNEATMLPSLWMVRRLWPVPVVLHVRSVMHDWSTPRGRFLRRSFIDRADRIIAIDETVAESLPASTRSTVIHNGLCEPLENHVGDVGEARPFTVGMVGNLLKVKGCLEFVQAAKICRDQGLVVRFAFHGQSARPLGGLKQALTRVLGLSQEVEAELRDYVARHGLDDTVEFKGFSEDLGSIYRSLDVVCFPSHYNAPGRPIFEAAFYGIPAIAAVSAPRADTIRPGETGLVVQPGDPLGLAHAIRVYALDPELRSRHGRDAQRLARSLFAAADNAARVLDLYGGVLGEEVAAQRGNMFPLLG